MSDIAPFRILSSEPAFSNRWWNVVKERVTLPDGGVADYFINHSPGGVLVVPVTEHGNVVVNRQYKHGARAVVDELTVGRIDEADGEPLAAAKRELLEETGYGEGEWEHLATLISNPTSSTARLHVYLARDVRKVAAPKRDPKEIVEAREVAPADFIRMAFEGGLPTHASLAAALLAAKKLNWISVSV
jgi:ADP-ribose pyrophosphatase